MAIFKELRERRFFQIVASYAAAGWIVLSVVDQLADRGVFGNFIYHLSLVWYLVGLLVAIVAGWYHGEKGSQQVTRLEVVLISLAGLVGLASSGAVLRNHFAEVPTGVTAGGTGELDPSRIAVLYFDDASRDGSLGYLADGLTESLIDELAAVPSLHVVSRNGSLQVRDSDLPKDSVARVLQAGTLVTGVVEEAGDDVEINVALSDGPSGVEFRRGTFEAPAQDVFQARDQLAEQVSVFLREWLGEEIDLRREEEGTDNVAAWALLQRGERARKEGDDLLDQGDVDQAMSLFQQCDSLLTQAASLDPNWPRPWVLRGRVAMTMGQYAASTPTEAERLLDAGIEDVERALSLDRRNAYALESRGVIRYVEWRMGIETDPVRSQELFEGAEEDLKTATRIDPTRAYAWNILSMVYSDKPDLVGAKIAARTAYEQDAFLRGAQDLLWRLYATSYDLEQFPDAIQYCNEGRRRFPDYYRFVECQLWLLASRAMEPDVDRAWQLDSLMNEMLPARGAEYTRLKGQILVGGVLARAELTDSAHALWERSRGNAEIDPPRDLLALEAVFRLQAGEKDEALELVKTYLTLNPEHRSGWTWTSHWWWRGLQDNQEFKDLLGAGGG